MIQDFKYFFWGSLGTREVCLYALFNPVLDGFLICSTDYSIMYQMQQILSSRYMLHIVEIAHADNFETGLIDNTCCENWSYLERNLLWYNHMSRAIQWHAAKNLCQSTKPLDIDLIEEKKYAMMCAHWIKYFDLDAPLKFKSQLSHLIGYGDLDPDFTVRKQKAMRLLYMGVECEKTDADIRQLVDE